jgi:hypothetical protein
MRRTRAGEVAYKLNLLAKRPANSNLLHISARPMSPIQGPIEKRHTRVAMVP